VLHLSGDSRQFQGPPHPFSGVGLIGGGLDSVPFLKYRQRQHGTGFALHSGVALLDTRGHSAANRGRRPSTGAGALKKQRRTILAQLNPKQVEALSAISDIIVQISDDDLERMESLAQQITPFDRELGDRILDAYTLLIQLNDDVESALERLEPDLEEEEMEDDEDLEAAAAEADETNVGNEEDAAEERGKARSKRKK
jgi:hypothetical protein